MSFLHVRRNHPGDRTKALQEILPIVESGNNVASDVYCLCGRIYKDMFMSSMFTDVPSRDQACFWYLTFGSFLFYWSTYVTLDSLVLHFSLLHDSDLFFIRYGKAFEMEPTLHSGINSVVLLIASGHEFETSIELRKIGTNRKPDTEIFADVSIFARIYCIHFIHIANNT